MSRFSDIMVYLHPKAIIEKTETSHNAARGKCTLQSPIAQDYNDFEESIIAYTSFHMAEVFGNSPPPEFCLNIARRYIDEAVGFDNAAFIALSGSEGGMNNVLNLIADGFKKEAKAAYVTYVIDKFISPLNFEEIVEVMREFKERLGQFCPESMNYISPEAMAGSYKKIIWSYFEGLSRHRNLWSY